MLGPDAGARLEDPCRLRRRDLVQQARAWYLKPARREARTSHRRDKCYAVRRIHRIRAPTRVARYVRSQDRHGLLSPQLKGQQVLKGQIAGLENMGEQSAGHIAALESEIAQQRAYVVNLRKNISQSDATLEADVRKQINLEQDIRSLQSAESRLSTFLERAESLVDKLVGAEEEQKKFPSDLYSKRDRVKISVLEKNFRANASAFNYTSADIPEVQINAGTLLPALGDITLREVLKRNVKSESSASDFVRLIWAFLLAVYQTSSTRDYAGNHASVLMFDEPGQHSMSETSQKALVNLMSGLKRLQSILAASFDESVAVFDRVTEGSHFHLIELPEKFIGPMRHNGGM